MIPLPEVKRISLVVLLLVIGSIPYLAYLSGVDQVLFVRINFAFLKQYAVWSFTVMFIATLTAIQRYRKDSERDYSFEIAYGVLIATMGPCLDASENGSTVGL